jgi:formylglycine-generating enzyme required for sulfatase activity
MNAAEPILIEPEMLPLAAPDWAEEFGEDQSGVYCRFRIGGVPFVMRWIPPGVFQMGSPQDEQGRWDDEGPQHEVTISQGYWLGETPVTQEQWRAVVKATATELPESPSHFKDKPQHPVESVNWHQCVQFCDLVQGLLQSTQPFRLPTEAQWEYACRAGTTSAFHDGSACTQPTGKDPALDRLGWFNQNSGSSTCPVRQKVANNWGLYDMHGNVREWCRDSMRDYKAEACVDPSGPESSGASRVLRGGGWVSSAGVCRAAFRDANVPGGGWGSGGLRLSAGPSGFSGGAGDL